MADIGMGSLTNYEQLAQAAARTNADAARGYFPELDKSKKAPPMKLHESESCLVKLSQDIEHSIKRSPDFVQRRKRTVPAGWNGEVKTLSHFYTGDEDRVGETGPSEDLWDLKKCWIIPELLPSELIPKQVRTTKREKTLVKRARISPHLSLAADDQEEAEADAEAQGEDDDEGGQNEAVVANEEEDDLELDADYQTGNHFDDDEGYDDPDSGAEEATF